MPRKRFGIDIDGVLANFTLAFTSLASDRGLIDNQLGWGPEAQKTWFFDFRVDPVWGAVDEIPNWWMTLLPIPSPGELERLARAAAVHDVYFITNRRRTVGLGVETQSQLWLQGLGIQADHVIATQKGKKGKLCAALDLTHFVDDNAENCEEIEAAGIQTYCRTWPYNSEWSGKRVSSLGQFLSEVLS